MTKLSKQTHDIEWDTIRDLTNVIDSLTRTSKDRKENKQVRHLAQMVVVYLVCLRVDLEAALGRDLSGKQNK